MDYGERLAAAMQFAGYRTDAHLAADLTALLRAQNMIPVRKKIGAGTIQSARSGRVTLSKFNAQFAQLCRVSAEWLASGVGEMLVSSTKRATDWPFDFPIEKYLRLSPSEKRRIELVLEAMIGDAGDDAITKPKRA